VVEVDSLALMMTLCLDNEVKREKKLVSMGLFKNIFGDSEESNNESKMAWSKLTDLGQLNEIINESTEKPVAIFKHSTRCSISRMALRQFEQEFDLEGKVLPYYLDLLEHRDISNEIANRFNVYHQSPQLIVIKDGKAVYDRSHESIDAKKLVDFV
jgi:bacillithiol system protein YtxJ